MAPIAPTCIDPTAPIDPKLLEVAIQMVEREKGRALTADEQTSVQQQVRVDFLHQCTSDCRLIVYKLDKWLVALQMIRLYPEKWFRRRQVDDRDQALINSDPTPAVPVGPKSSYLRNMVRDTSARVSAGQPLEPWLLTLLACSSSTTRSSSMPTSTGQVITLFPACFCRQFVLTRPVRRHSGSSRPRRTAGE